MHLLVTEHVRLTLYLDNMNNEARRMGRLSTVFLQTKMNSEFLP